METVDETDIITKNIVKEIVRECAARDHEIDENFCVYYVKLLTLDPRWQISPECTMNRENIQKIVSYSIEKLMAKNCPNLTTLRIQNYFLANMIGQSIMIEQNKVELQNCVAPLKEDIINFNLEDKTSDLKVHRRIVLLITLLSGLGNPKHMAVLKEATYALRSIFEVDDIPEFMKLNRYEKENELQYLRKIVVGIRLFNRDCGKPAAEIEDLPRMLTQALSSTHTELQNELLRVMEKVNLTTSALENVYVIEFNTESGKYFLKRKLPEGVSLEFLDETRNLLLLARQHEVYVRKIMSDVQEIEKKSKELFNKLQEAYIKLHAIVKFKVAIASNVVYPLFIELSDVWEKIQDVAILLSRYNRIFQTICKYVRIEYFDEKRVKLMIGEGSVQTDAMRLEKTMGLKIPEKGNRCQILDPLEIKDFDKIPLQYLGFCVWSLVETNGGLIPGNPNIGICKWKDKYYVFASLEAAAEFGGDPDSYVLRSLEIARCKPEFINLLQLHEQVCSVRHVDVLYVQPKKVVYTKTVDVQTDLHPVPTNIDPNYVWNIWDYYRQAIKLANITQCQTHSVQTMKSHFRCPVFVQTTEPRDKNLQTKTDNYTNVPTLSNFIFGLRGRLDDNQHIIELTRPVDE